MANSSINQFIINITAGIFIFLQIANLHAAQPKEKSSYSIGISPQFTTRKIQTIWRPILAQLTQKTGIHLTLHGVSTIADFETEFMGGSFDFAYTNAYRLMASQKSQGYIPLARDIERQLYGVIVVRKDSPIHNVKELDGKKIAFPSANAMGASLMIRADLKRIFNINFTPLYTQTHNSSYLNVILGNASAGGGVQKTFNQQEPEIKNRLRVLYETKKVAAHAFVGHPRVPAAVRKQIQQAMLEIGKSESGKRLLSFVPIKKIGITTIKDYEPILKMGLDEFYVKQD